MRKKTRKVPTAVFAEGDVFKACPPSNPHSSTVVMYNKDLIVVGW